MKKIICIVLIVLLNFNFTKAFAIDNKDPNSVEITLPKMVNSEIKEDKMGAIVENEEIIYSNEYVSVDINKPIVRLPNKEIEGIINSKISKKVSEFENYIVDLSKKDNMQYKKDGLPLKQYVVNINNTVNYNKDNILSLTLHFYSYTGGAHGSSVDVSYNFDVNTGNNGVLEDFLGKDKKYNKIILNNMKEIIDKNPNMYFKEVTDNINEIPYNQKFFLVNDYVIIYFDEYEIAPYAAGIVQFKIPLKSFKAPLVDVNIKVEAPSIKTITYENNSEVLNEYLGYPMIENMENKEVEQKINKYFKDQVFNFQKDIIARNQVNEGTPKYVRAITTYFRYMFKDKNSIILDITYCGNNNNEETIVFYNRKYNVNLNNGKILMISEDKEVS
ncbi:DUF4163 domain-containing protein [Clostridium sp.]|uniref:PdaC/SigV domain-containing protein n=1 Tax=Clostridium sp. TaxID=1506 RepID=UPI003217C9CA